MKRTHLSTALSLLALATASAFLLDPAPAAAAPAPALGGINYCTAGTSTNGCNATMSCTGIPSVSASSGYVLTTSNLEGQKNALIRYSISGPISLSWGVGSSSFLCIKAPTQKMGPVQNSGGTVNACDGSISVDFLAWSAAHPNALGQPLSAGTVVYVQTIYKDPSAPKTTNWSDALEFTMLP